MVRAIQLPEVAARTPGHGKFLGMLVLVVALLVAQSTPPQPPKPAPIVSSYLGARGAKRTPFTMKVKESTTIITAYGEVQTAVLVTEKDETFTPKKTAGDEKGTGSSPSRIPAPAITGLPSCSRMGVNTA